ncbi:MAG: hypothetical protein JNG89_01450 [Planctomycetaceae bacterium]|nr:hypothetical protein [Planctomycetaceae bacterium]
MTRCLLSAVAVYILCVSMTGSAAAGSKTEKIERNVVIAGIVVDQTTWQTSDGTVVKLKQKWVTPNGDSGRVNYRQDSHGTSTQTKVKYADGTSRKWKTRN